jgi:hypothetical protein
MVFLDKISELAKNIVIKREREAFKLLTSVFFGGIM